MEEIDRLITALRRASYDAREPIKAELIERAQGIAGAPVREHLEAAKRSEILEVQWEIEEVLEATTPKKAVVEAPAPPPPEPPKPEPKKGLTSRDLTLLYDDPRGLQIHKKKDEDLYVVTQIDPNTMQPVRAAITPQQFERIKGQLDGSPFWVLGADTSTKPAPAPQAPASAPASAPGASHEQKGLSAADFTLIYDDPEGLQIHKKKDEDLYLITQINPNTMQPEQALIPGAQFERIKVQLDGSPYWVGAAPAPRAPLGGMGGMGGGRMMGGGMGGMGGGRMMGGKPPGSR